MSIHKHQGKLRRGQGYWLYGVHAVSAALANPQRRVNRILLSKAGDERLAAVLDARRHPRPEPVEARQLERQLGAEAVHQGVAAEIMPLEPLDLDSLVAQAGERPIVLLDQVTDPHNVGAILRSAAAFDAAGIVLTEHHAPPESAVMAKAASGALETVPLCYVTNLSQAMETLKQAGWWVAGLDGEAKLLIRDAKLTAKTALVLGAEGRGLRRLTGERCDLLVKLPIHAKMESLNVSNAAAVALYELYRER